MDFHARFPLDTPRVTAVLSDYYQARPVQKEASVAPDGIMISARRAPKAFTFGLNRPMKLKLSILDYTFEGCPADPASAMHQNTRDEGEAQIWNTVNVISATDSIKFLQRALLLSYVQVVAPCQCAPPHRAMALGCQASIFGFVLSYDQHLFKVHILDVLDIRVVWLVCASRGGVVRDVVRFRPAAGYFGDGVLRWGLVDGVGDPCVPEGLDLGAIFAEGGQPASLASILFKG